MIAMSVPPVVAPAQAEAADLVGRWEGALNVGGTSLPLVIRVEADGQVFMDSPAQNARGIPVTELSETGGVVRFTVPVAHGRFEGARSADGQTWTGAWSQGAASLPLILTRAASTAEPAGPARPQTPVPPFPYAAETVTFPNAGAGITLAGTLTLPAGAGPFPAVVLLTGSGAQDRDETIFDHKPFAVWADALTRRGVAVLRYDDRGVGGSGGGGLDETSQDFATDAAAAVAWLRTRPEIDPARIGLMGHSEGGMIAPLVVQQGTAAAFVVMIAGPAVTGGELIAEQAHRIGAASGASAEQLAAADAVQRRLMSIIAQNAGDQEAARTAVEAELLAAGMPPASAANSADTMSGSYYRWFVAHDPAPALAVLQQPLLAIYGSKDLTVPADQNAEALARVRPDAEIVILPGLNHLMQTAGNGLPGEYGTIEETIAPAALTTVGDWIVRMTAR